MAKSTDITYYSDATAKCTNCGSTYTLGSTIQTLSIEICGNCHPFYTGKAILVDTAGRIDKFKSRMEKVQTGTKSVKSKVRKQVQSLSDLMVEEEAPVEEKKEKPTKKAEAKSEPKAAAKEVKAEIKVETKTESAQTATTDFTKIEGIGPKISELLNANGYKSFEDLAKADLANISKLLEENSLASHKPDTWSQQSQMAADGKWAELKTWQDELNGGKAEEKSAE